MEELDAFLSAAIPVKVTKKTEPVQGKKRLNPIFEDFEFREQYDYQLHKDWFFCAPRTIRPVTTKLSLILRECAPSLLRGTTGVSKILNDISVRINTIKSAMVEEAASEGDLLYYVAVLRAMQDLMENNSAVYSYRIPTDFDAPPTAIDTEPAKDQSGTGGENLLQKLFNRNESARPTNLYFNSDALLFEYINVLLTLLARYCRLGVKNPSHTDTLQSNKDRYGCYSQCVELLQEIRHRIPTRTATISNRRLRYHASPLSLSNTDAPSPQQQQQNIDKERADTTQFMIEFGELYLGGPNHITARIHLCEAKKNEIFYENFSVDKTRHDDPYAKVVPVMASIILEYEAAYKSLLTEQQCKLYQYCRFQAHYWFCKTHYLLAHFEARLFQQAHKECALDQEFIDNMPDDDYRVKSACRALSRLDYVIARCKEMDHLIIDTRQIVLDAQLTAEYDEYVAAINALLKELDTRLYTERHISTTKFTAQEMKLDSRTYTQRTLFEDSVTKLVNESAQFKKEIETLRKLAQCYHQNTVQWNDADMSQNTSVATTTAPTKNNTNAQTMTLEELIEMHDDLADAYNYGVLKERERFIAWFLTMHSHVDGEFYMPADFHDLLLLEAQDTSKMINKHEQCI